jgi:uncharacterized delta-60 repeat protein
MKTIPLLVKILLFSVLFLTRAGSLSAQTSDSFNPNMSLHNVYCAVLQPDGKVLVGGNFTTAGGVTHNRIVRLRSDGAVDTGFNPPDNSGVVFAMAVQPDGKILVAGGTFVGASNSYLVRLNADGSLDPAFSPNPDNSVNSILVQPTGKIVIGGRFSFVNGVSHTNLARLNPDGTLDAAFTPIPNGEVECMAQQADGSIVFGGNFGGVSAQSHINLARISADGVLDASFTTFTNVDVYCIAVQTDGRIVIGGFFNTVNNISHNHIARLNPDGSIDTSISFNLDNTAFCLALQADGKMVLGGKFTKVGTTTRNHVARLNADGTLDSTYDPNVNGEVDTVALQGDGKLLIGGLFTSVGGTTRNCLARVTNPTAAVQTITVTGTSEIDWMRSGGAPEIGEVSFDAWIGSTWVSQGAATRISGGWQLTGLSLPVSTWVRARGLARTGRDMGSVAVIQQIATYGGAVPDISVEQPSGNSLVSGLATVDLGTRDWLTTSTPKVFTLRNTGTGTLGNIAITVDGANPGDFVVSAPGATSLPPGNSTTFTVTFTPRGCGLRSIAVHIASNDADETPFELSITGTGQQGDGTFTPGVDGGQVYAAVTQPDGKILIGGSFTLANGTLRNHIARLNADGTLDTAFDPNANGDVTNIALLADGRIAILGAFTKIGTISRSRGAMLTAAGALDPNSGTNLDLDATGYCVAVQADGKVILGGDFLHINGGIIETRVARLLSNTQLDSGFATTADGTVRAIVVQPDGNVILGGDFFKINGTTHAQIARVTSAGVLDTTFATAMTTQTPNPSITCMALQADGKVIIGGTFNTVGGAAHTNIARLNTNGTVDSAFNAALDNTPNTLSVQADGKILLGGTFDKANLITRHKIARFNSDGTLDTSFDPGANAPVYSLGQQFDGKILAGGNFTTVGNESVKYLARLPNDSAPVQIISVTGTSQINWARSGPAPEVSQVTFDSWSGSAWVSQGSATRIAGGWQRTGLSLPASTWIRARARTFSGRDSASSGIIEQIAPYGTNLPRISVEQPSGNSLANGSAIVDFGPVATDSARFTIFTIRNIGSGTLGSLNVTVDGTNGPDVTLGTLGATSLAPNATTTFAVFFLPGAAGVRNAALHVTGSDIMNTPYDVGLTAFGVSSQQGWRYQYFGTISNVGSAADLYDYAHDGISNLLKWALHLDPTKCATLPATTSQSGGNLFYTYTRSDNAINAGAYFTVQWSDTLAPDGWTNAGVTENILSDDGTVQQVQATVSAGTSGHRFLRLLVISP